MGRFEKLSMFILTSLIALFLWTGEANASCSAPAAETGEITYNQKYKAFQGCTRAGWKAFHAVIDPCKNSPVPGQVCLDGTIYAGTSPDGGVMMFTPANGFGNLTWGNHNVTAPGLSWCIDGEDSCRTGKANTDLISTYPVAKYCADLTDHGHSDWYLPSLEESLVLYSHHAAIGGFGGSYHWTSSVSYNYPLAVHFATGGYTITNGNSVLNFRCVRSNSIIGPISNTPNAVAFTDLTNQALNTQITSDSPAIFGIGPGPIPVSVTGAGTPEISVNGGAWVTSGTITNGQTLTVRLTSANTSATLRSATITVGTVSDQWDVTTTTQDDTPAAYNFSDTTGQALNTVVTTNSLTITDIGPAPVAVSITGAGSPQININGGGWVTGGNISNGQILQLRLTSANAYSTLRSATVTVGTVSDQWDVTTMAAPAPVTRYDGSNYVSMYSCDGGFADPNRTYYWDGIIVASTSAASVSTGGYTYSTGSYVTSYQTGDEPPCPPGAGNVTFTHYQVTRVAN